MEEEKSRSESLEIYEDETSSNVDSMTESEQDTSDSLGNLNIQAGASKRSCSDGDLDTDEDQLPKWRCIRDEDESNSISNSINDENANNNGNLVGNDRILSFVNDYNNSTGDENVNYRHVFTDALRDTPHTSDQFCESAENDKTPYRSHLAYNHICAAEMESGEDLSHINSLPHMIMTRIFSYLPLSDLLKRACLVCRYWRNLAYDPVLWRNINLKSHSKVDDHTLLGLVQLSQNVNVLDVTDSKFITSEGVMKALKHCRWLATLKLVRVPHLNVECVSSIGASCPNMKTLHLDSCYSLSDDSLKKIAEGCSNQLEELRLNYCSSVSDKGIESVSSSCHNLQHLMLTQCQQVTNSCMESLVTGCPRLETLLLMSCGLTDVGVIKIAKLQNMKMLDISNIGALTPRSVEVIVRSCQKLESLNLSLCRSMNDECVKYIARTANNLKHLYMVSCNLTDKALHYVADYSKTIETLDVGWCQDLTIQGVIKVSTTCVKTLQYLGLMRCDKILPPEMDEIVDRFPTISYSTMHLDCKRLLERARREGHLSGEQGVK